MSVVVAHRAPAAFAGLLVVALLVPSATVAQPLAATSPYQHLVASLVPADGGTGAVAGPVAVRRLPRCGVRDLPTRYGRVKDWRRTLLDTNLRLDADYEPWDLVPVRRAGVAGSGRVRKLMIDDLAAMAKAARTAGKPIFVRSAYRSYATQKAIFDREKRRVGAKLARRFIARPGHSEHQLGTTIDLAAASGAGLSQRFGTTPAGRWMARNGWKYGFVLSYPKGKKRASCYGYEPWHWRYVGRDLARAIHESGQVPRRFLWERFESAPSAEDDPLTLLTDE